MPCLTPSPHSRICVVFDPSGGGQRRGRGREGGAWQAEHVAHGVRVGQAAQVAGGGGGAHAAPARAAGAVR
eukprot:1179718-Prorocentrum_minimum.AAC.1